MWRVILLFLTVVLVGAFAGWAIRRFTSRYSADSVAAVAAPHVAEAPQADVPKERLSESVRSGEPLASESEKEPPYVVGVSTGRGRLVVAWSDGTRQGEDDFAMAGRVVRVTRAAVWIDGERYPVQARRVPAVAAGVVAAPVAALPAVASAAAVVVPDDDPIWGYSQASRSWYLRDRSMVPGK